MKQTIAALAFAALAGCVVAIPVAPQATSVGPSDLVSTRDAGATTGFTQTLNQFRSEQGLAPVQQSAILTRAAMRHAQDMVARDYFSHRSPNGPDGDDLQERARAAGCGGLALAENIAQGQPTAQSVFESWRGSPGHRANMLGPRYRAYGLARAGDKWVLVLASGC